MISMAVIQPKLLPCGTTVVTADLPIDSGRTIVEATLQAAGVYLHSLDFTMQGSITTSLLLRATR